MTSLQKKLYKINRRVFVARHDMLGRYYVSPADILSNERSLLVLTSDTKETLTISDKELIKVCLTDEECKLICDVLNNDFIHF